MNDLEEFIDNITVNEVCMLITSPFISVCNVATHIATV